MKTLFALTVIVYVLGQSCGLRLRQRFYRRIVGGEPTIQGEFPYHVSLQYLGSHYCGGSILSTKVALTAAHCTSGVSPDKLSLLFGTNDLESGGEVVQVNEVAVHPQYAALDYDVSILILAMELSLGQVIGIVALQPVGQEPATGAAAVVTGWGLTSEGGWGTDILQKVTVNYVSSEDCNASYGGSITDRMICYAAPNKDSCQGDSGGPLVGDDKQVGIVSWSVGCARPNFPGVYTKVADKSIHDFITSYLK